MRRLTEGRRREISQYLLNDYQFLDDYEVVEHPSSNGYSFVALIKNTDQKVRFIRREYSNECLPRFKALHKLYKSGIVLADNMFILEQGESLFFYVIEAEVEKDSSRFATFQQYLFEKEITDDEKKQFVGKMKILLDCLHQEGQSYAGFDPRKIVIDQEKHVYLTPFDLEIELKTDSYSRSYYSPELLQKINQNQTEINTELMMKWDIWAFGCVCLQILLYQSPPFMSTSIKQQLRRIGQFQTQEQFSHLENSIKNTLANSLLLDMNLRTISAQPYNKKLPENPKIIPQAFPSVLQIQNQFRQPLRMKQLNLYQGEGECSITLTFLTLSNISFEKELRITVFADRNYNFFLDFDEKYPKKYTLNKKITIRSSLESLEKWMSKPLVVQLKEESKKAAINVNLCAMIMKVHGKRIWKDSIKGHYSSPADSSFPKARLKVSCLLQIPPQLQMQDNSQKELVPLPLKNDDQPIKKEIDCPPKGVQKVPSSSKHKILKKEQMNNIPSISEISHEIGLISEELKRKIGVVEVQDQLKKQLETLLEIETEQ